ncbi:hypothetical protein, partial [Acinetobacter guillouiae]|uniref:hypothetical protein n=1 Tax=Acinetobacter guillouiae TaxID=106649 RepID=UPI0026E38AD0
LNKFSFKFVYFMFFFFLFVFFLFILWFCLFFVFLINVCFVNQAILFFIYLKKKDKYRTTKKIKAVDSKTKK